MAWEIERRFLVRVADTLWFQLGDGHHFRQGHQARGVAGRGGIENQQVEAAPRVRHQVGHTLEQSGLHRAGRMACELELSVDLLVHLGGDQ